MKIDPGQVHTLSDPRMKFGPHTIAGAGAGTGVGVGAGAGAGVGIGTHCTGSKE